MDNTLRETPEEFEHMITPNNYGGSIRILFVEDSDEDMEIVRHSLQESRISNISKHVHNAEEALQCLESTDKLFDWIFVDRNLTGSKMSGDELIKTICQNPVYNECKVIVLSGQKMTVEEETFFAELDIDISFPKPLTARNILDMVATKTKNVWIDLFKRHERPRATI